MDQGERKIKDAWDKWDIVLKPAGGLLTALAVASLGFFTSTWLNHRQDSEVRTRLYTELLSQREQAESALRKDMFTSIIQTFLNPEKQRPAVREKLLNLELLTRNFHESIDLQPLFLDLQKEILSGADPEPAKRDSLARLRKLGCEICAKQQGILEGAGAKIDLRLQPALGGMPGAPLDRCESILELDRVRRRLTLSLLKYDLETREIMVRLEVETPSAGPEEPVVRAEFWVGFFDFPMIDNLRLSKDQRCAVVLRAFEQALAAERAPSPPAALEVSLLLFPGSHASLKEKPFFEDILEDLLPDARSTARWEGGSDAVR